MIRRAILLICFINIQLISTSFLGCSKYTNEKGVPEQYAYIAKQKQQSFHDGIVNGIRKEMAKQHVNVEVFYANHQKDLESQRAFIKQIINSNKFRGVMMCPNDSAELTKDIKLLDDSKIPFVLIDTPLKQTSVTDAFAYDCGYVGTDNFIVGKQALQYIVDHINGGNIVMMRGIHTHRSSIDREVGFLDKVKDYPNFKIIKYLEGGWATEPAFEDYQAFMKNNSAPISAVFAYNDHMALGISRFYDKNPGLKRPLIVGVDGTVVGQKGLLEGKIDAIVVQATELMGIEGLRRIMECSYTKPIRKKDVLTPVTILTTTTTLERSES